MRRRDVLTLAGLGAAAVMRPSWASAQSDAANWPNGNVTLVSPFTPGGMSDVLGRALSTDAARARPRFAEVHGCGSTEARRAHDRAGSGRRSRSSRSSGGRRRLPRGYGRSD